MDSLKRLNFTLKTSAYLLDSAAGQIRDAALSPTKEHIYKIGEALVSIYEIQQAIYKIKPELEPKYDEPSQEVSEANQRLGNALISAYELADNGKLDQAITLLSKFENSEVSDYHRELASFERERLNKNYAT
jgi:hypothetical protein